MTVQEECRLSYYSEIAEISEHKNITLVQHRETREVYVRKDLTRFDARVYRYLMAHPSRYFPQIYECIESDRTLIVIEEYIQGQNLETRLEEGGPFSEAETAAIAWEICEALALLHNQSPPMIHRDLKPSNVLIDKSGQVKIVDFDAARHFDEGKDGDTVVMGTRRYAAPEQYGYAQTDARTDIYALGVMLNRMLTGAYPSEERADGAMGRVIASCIELDPARRYQSARELQEALRRAVPSVGGGHSALRHPHLPPGFRTCTPWKMVLAILGYGIWLFVCLTMETNTVTGAAATGGILWANRICAAAIGILCLFFWFNYLGIHRFLPLMKKKRLKWLGYILYTALIVFVILWILVAIEVRL